MDSKPIFFIQYGGFFFLTHISTLPNPCPLNTSDPTWTFLPSHRRSCYAFSSFSSNLRLILKGKLKTKAPEKTAASLCFPFASYDSMIFKNFHCTVISLYRLFSFAPFNAFPPFSSTTQPTSDNYSSKDQLLPCFYTEGIEHRCTVIFP